MTSGPNPSDFRENPYELPAGLVPRYARDEPGRLTDSRSVRGYSPVQLRLPRRPELVPSADGRIAELLLTLPAYANHPDFMPVYADLIRKLPSHVRFVVLAHRQIADAVDERIGALRVRRRTTLLAAPDDIGFSIWAEDGYVVVRGDDGAGHFVEPFVFRRGGDALVADLVTSGTDLRLYQAPLYFQGGNVLVGDDFFLIGGDYITETIDSGVLEIDPGASPAAARKAVFAAYETYLDHRRKPIVVASGVPVPAETTKRVTFEGKRWTDVVYQGNGEGTVQPLFHIDMFVSLAGRGASGRYRVLVGDPRLAAEVLGAPVPPYAMVEVFDDIAQRLTRAGFEVTRNPLPLVAVADRARRVRSWYFATSNNALVEVDGNDRRVWLPSYGHTAWPELKATDQANARIWRGLGFKAQLLGDFHPFAQNLGAVHCIKKYLRREAETLPRARR